MFLGLPVICSISGVNCEIIKDNYSGMLVASNEFESQLENSIRMLNKNEIRTEIGKNGLNTVKKHFSSESMTISLINYLKHSFVHK